MVEGTANEKADTFRHAPEGYVCPFCRFIQTGESDFPLEILHRYEHVIVRMNPKWWPRNRGGALVLPIDHYENVFDLPIELGSPIQEAVRDTALAMKAAFGCSGISTRQHNEPAGNQNVWHYHVHVFPRSENDGLYGSRGAFVAPDEVRQAADLLRSAWPSQT